MEQIKCIAAMLMLAGSPASADSVVIHGLSYHPDFLGDTNPYNVGVGYRTDDYAGIKNLDWQFGVYLNSWERVTVYNVFDYTADNGLGVFAGFASGYYEPHTVAGVTLVAGGVWQMEYGTIRATPALNNSGKWGAVVAYSLTHK